MDVATGEICRPNIVISSGSLAYSKGAVNGTAGKICRPNDSINLERE